jgi:diguanylate cyclase (GGDEF)-like protein
MVQSQHILLVEDEAAARGAMAALLREEGYRVTAVIDGIEALDAVDREVPDLVISDVNMPRCDGFHLVRRLRDRPATAHVPIVLVSALAAPNRRVVGLDLGADDFVAKPIDFGELLARVRAHLRRAHERDDLERRAVIDGLTGILNRRGIAAVLQREIQRSRRSGTPLSVLMIDVDRFKKINDDHGHQAGDTVLRHVARSVADVVRVVDQVGRFGGDEFLVVLPDADASAAATLAGRLHTLRLPPLAVGADTEVDVTISTGVATLRADDTTDSLVERADRDMYRVKRTGEMMAVQPR